MFTGLTEETGRVQTLSSKTHGLRVQIVADHVLSKLKLGDSVAVNGICSTVVDVTMHQFTVEYSAETVAVTTVSNWRVHEPVNLELSLTPATRLGGHFVSGHVDTIGQIKKLQTTNAWATLVINFPKEFAHLLVIKGSVTVDGISLTVAALGDDYFAVAVIPHTWQNTNLASKKSGDQVNLEFDILGKYLHRFYTLEQQRGGKTAEQVTDQPSSLQNALAKAGFL